MSGVLRSQARLDAQAAGWPKFTAEAPCFRGHAPVRYTSTGVCVECLRLRQSGKLPRPSLERAAVERSASLGMPRNVTLQMDVPVLDVRYLQVCAALLAHPTQARLLRAFLERNQHEVRAPLPGSILKRI